MKARVSSSITILLFGGVAVMSGLGGACGDSAGPLAKSVRALTAEECAAAADGKKVSFCHREGENDSGVTITTAVQACVNGHVANHPADSLGPCCSFAVCDETPPVIPSLDSSAGIVADTTNISPTFSDPDPNIIIARFGLVGFPEGDVRSSPTTPYGRLDLNYLDWTATYYEAPGASAANYVAMRVEILPESGVDLVTLTLLPGALSYTTSDGVTHPIVLHNPLTFTKVPGAGHELYVWLDSRGYLYPAFWRDAVVDLGFVSYDEAVAGAPL